MSIRVMLADDDAIIREGLKSIIEVDDRFELVGLGKNGKEAYRICRDNDVDVALLDIRMPEMNGVEATLKIVGETETKVLILTTFEEDEFIQKAFENGASGYLLKGNSSDMIRNAIQSVHGGNVVVQGGVMDQITKKKERNLTSKLSELTPREVEVAELIAEGLTNKEIAEHLFISDGTVRNLVSAILSKLELNHRTQIAVYLLGD